MMMIIMTLFFRCWEDIPFFPAYIIGDAGAIVVVVSRRHNSVLNLAHKISPKPESIDIKLIAAKKQQRPSQNDRQ